MAALVYSITILLDNLLNAILFIKNIWHSAGHACLFWQTCTQIAAFGLGIGKIPYNILYYSGRLCPFPSLHLHSLT